MTLTDFALDYDQCSVLELQSFVKARTGETITGDDDYYVDRLSQADYDSSYELFDLAEWKAPYITALRRADRTATFRFFDLAPELRNLVYDELLLLEHKGDREYCWPLILAACHRTHDEAEGILYEDNVVSLVFWDIGSYVGIGDKPLQRRGIQIDDCNIAWPAHLLRVKRLRFAVRLSGRQYLFEDWRLRVINLAIWHLHYFIFGKSNVQELQIHLETKHPQEADWLRDVLSPARLIAPTIHITASGLTPGTLQNLLAAMSPAQSVSPATEVLARYQRIVSRKVSAWNIPFSMSIDPHDIARRRLMVEASRLKDVGNGFGLMTVDVDAQLHRLLHALDAYPDDRYTKAKEEEPRNKSIVDDKGTIVRWLARRLCAL